MMTDTYSIGQTPSALERYLVYRKKRAFQLSAEISTISLGGASESAKT